MKRIIPLFLALCLLLGGCGVGPETPPEERELTTEPTSSQEEGQPTSLSEPIFIPSVDLQQETNTAFLDYASEVTNRAVLAVILNEPFESEPEATVVWNEGEYDRLYIIPRYVGSYVNVYGIIWDEEGGFTYTDKAVYSAYADEGCVIYAALTRPEGMPQWYVEVVSPLGRTAGLTLTYNGLSGTPAQEWINAGDSICEFGTEVG